MSGENKFNKLNLLFPAIPQLPLLQMRQENLEPWREDSKEGFINEDLSLSRCSNFTKYQWNIKKFSKKDQDSISQKDCSKQKENVLKEFLQYCVDDLEQKRIRRKSSYDKSQMQQQKFYTLPNNNDQPEIAQQQVPLKNENEKIMRRRCISELKQSYHLPSQKWTENQMKILVAEPYKEASEVNCKEAYRTKESISVDNEMQRDTDNNYYEDAHLKKQFTDQRNENRELIQLKVKTMPDTEFFRPYYYQNSLNFFPKQYNNTICHENNNHQLSNYQNGFRIRSNIQINQLKRSFNEVQQCVIASQSSTKGLTRQMKLNSQRDISMTIDSQESQTDKFRITQNHLRQSRYRLPQKNSVKAILNEILDQKLDSEKENKRSDSFKKYDLDNKEFSSVSQKKSKSQYDVIKLVEYPTLKQIPNENSVSSSKLLHKYKQHQSSSSRERINVSHQLQVEESKSLQQDNEDSGKQNQCSNVPIQFILLKYQQSSDNNHLDKLKEINSGRGSVSRRKLKIIGQQEKQKENVLNFDMKRKGQQFVQLSKLLQDTAQISKNEQK